MFRRRSQKSPDPAGGPAKERAGQRVTTPLLLQMHATECGAACLGSILAYFGLWVPLNELRGRCEVSRDGSSAGGLARAARHYGLKCAGFSVDIGRLKTMRLPLILFWEFNHFLILEGHDRDRFFLNDPATGRRTLSLQEFDKGFTGIALQFETGPAFQPGGARLGILKRIPRWLDGAWGALGHVVACALMLALLALVIPGMLAIFVDRILGEGEPWGVAVALVMAAAAALAYGLTWLKARWLQRLAVRVSVVAANRCVSRLLRLPVEFFNHRLVGDLTARVLSIDDIAGGMSEKILPVLIDIVMSVAFVAVMLAYDPVLALAVLGLAAANAALMRVVVRMRIDKSHALRREQGLLFGVGTLMLSHSDTVRMTGADDSFFARWGGHQARELAARQRFAELGHVTSALPALFTILGYAAVLALGATRVMAGEMTLGTLAAFYVVAGMFLAPVGRFVEFADERQTLETHMQRLDDITETPESSVTAEPSASSDAIGTMHGRLQLAGHVELRDITFGYNRARPPLIKDFNLTIRPGQRVAVVGPSGSGKSTLSRLVSGVYPLWSGEILFDGGRRDDIPGDVMSRSLSMVDQHVSLFSATVRDNITLWNPSVPDEAVVAAARDACVHDEILSRPLGYATQVDENGGNFSGGQRQRLEIARALASSPTVLILDEATSALDAATEERIDDALRRRGVSCLIVAHRLSTIRDCDQIIVLDKGAEVQRGTHDELMADEDGVYFRLVQAG